MQIRPEALSNRLARGLDPLYTLSGDEPLQVQEAGDAIRAAARAGGCSERQVFTVSGAHFDWSGVLGAAQAMSLFAERRLIEIRIPSGKPGKDGSEALQRYAERLPEDVVTLVTLPRLDWQQSKSGWFAALDAAGPVIRCEVPDRNALPTWLAQRLVRQGQGVAEGDAGRQALAWFAERIEGNLLAARQELDKLALLHGPGPLTLEQIQASVQDLARYDTTQLADAVWLANAPRARRILAGLKAEGEAVVRVHWALAEELRQLRTARAALDAGQPPPMAMKAARIWSSRERVLERALPRLGATALAELLAAAQVCDGIAKGLKRPDWPEDPWDAVERWLLMCVDALLGKAERGLALRG
jgi:DNA polymerase-3 subunit delta